MMTLSQFTLEDVEALCLGPSFLMADPMGPLLDQDEEEALSPSSSLEGEVPASPPLSLSPSSTLLSPPSPPLSHCTSFLEAKGGVLNWLSVGGLLDAHVGADDGKDDAFTGMEWMAEKIDLGDLDLESLIDSCSSEESPESSEDLLASLHSHVDLDLDTFNTPVLNEQLELQMAATVPEPPLTSLEVPKEEVAPAHQVFVKSEPCSPAPSPFPPSSPMSDLGSEVDTKSPLADITPDASGSPIVVMVLGNKDTTLPVSLPELSVVIPPTPSDCESDSGIESVAGSPPRDSSPAPGSSRTKPYAKPEPASPSSLKGKVKSASGPKVVEKKLKKMEQNKTAATRYRQKKRVEQEQLGVEREELEKKNRELAEKAESISKEIQYLRDLMEEVRKHHRGKMSSGAT
uniref:cyclic AMP-dependent transcription factor ATF-4 isoform X2 n=1 Tax=Doryrhamphus excisus TaxID=161450 RepID=UPI0025ADDCB6|nr:cyclic AMP-dependent transcription factor ATF-4 isoform X2 [Doryrhamphus excisus]